LVRGIVPDAYVVAVGCFAVAFPIRGNGNKHHSVRVAVDGGVAEIGVVAAAVLVGGAVDKGGFLGGLFEVGALGLPGALDSGTFERIGAGRLGGGGIFERLEPSGAAVSGLGALGLPPGHERSRRAQAERR
jgi:hypothetical protein